MWNNLIEQLRYRLYYFLQFMSNNVLEEYVMDKVEYLQPEVFQIHDYLLNKIGGLSHYLELVTFMKENGINEDFFENIKKIPEEKIPTWIKEEIKNFLSLEEYNEEDIINILEILVDIYQYI